MDLRHALATLAYRAEKVLRDVPESFPRAQPLPSARTPLHVLAHMADLMAWGERMARGQHRWEPVACGDWNEARDRFFAGLAALDAALVEATPDAGTEKAIFPGPIADALTHVGQLALLRGQAGARVRPENYARAAIEIGTVGLSQSAERVEFDGDASP